MDGLSRKICINTHKQFWIKFQKVLDTNPRLFILSSCPLAGLVSPFLTHFFLFVCYTYGAYQVRRVWNGLTKLACPPHRFFLGAKIIIYVNVHFKAWNTLQELLLFKVKHLWKIVSMWFKKIYVMSLFIQCVSEWFIKALDSLKI